MTEEHVRGAKQRYGSLFTRQLFAEQVSTKFGIVSFTADPKHPLMWAHYTTDGSGFAIGYDKSAIAKLAGANGALLPVQYSHQPAYIAGPVALASLRSDLPQFLSRKSDHWSYEDERRLIVEMNETIRMGKTDRHGQPVNLVRVPNEAVVRVYHTERTPPESVDTIRDRLADHNNRYQTESPTQTSHVIHLVRIRRSTGVSPAERPDDEVTHALREPCVQADGRDNVWQTRSKKTLAAQLSRQFLLQYDLHNQAPATLLPARQPSRHIRLTDVPHPGRDPLHGTPP